MNLVVRFYSSLPNSFEMQNGIPPEWPAETYAEGTSEFETYNGQPGWSLMTDSDLKAHMSNYEAAKDAWNAVVYP